MGEKILKQHRHSAISRSYGNTKQKNLLWNKMISLNFNTSINKSRNKQVYSWALYDWANSAFSVTVLTGLFPLFFRNYWHAGADTTTTTFHLGLANSLASVVIVFIAPILGSIADSSRAKKRFLIFFACLGIVMTTALYFVAQGEWLWAFGCYVLASIGFMTANTFYDSLIVSVASTQELDIISSLGYSLGYLGGGLLFLINVMMVSNPEWFGIIDKSTAVRLAFVSVALWWLIFSIPIMLFVHEPEGGQAKKPLQAIRSGFRQLYSTFQEIKKLKVVLLFLISYWLYIDGVDTVIRMAVDFGLSIGLNSDDLIIAILITQFIGFPAAIGFGFLGNKIGTKQAIMIAIIVYIFVSVFSVVMDSVEEFYAMAIVIGLVQGGIQSLSRSFFARIIPANKSAEFFGFYNMMGKFAVVIGPVLVGSVALISGDPRYSMLSIIVLFLLGGLLLYFVDENKGIENAKALSN